MLKRKVLVAAVFLGIAVPSVSFANEEISRPNDIMTRAEAAALFAKSLLDPKYIEAFSESHFFDDVEKGSWYAGYIGALHQSGVWSGLVENGNILPHSPITDRELYTLITLAMRESTSEQHPSNFPITRGNAERMLTMILHNEYTLPFWEPRSISDLLRQTSIELEGLFVLVEE